MDGESATCYDAPALRDMIKDHLIPGRVVVSNKCITSVGPGSSVEFALVLVKLLVGREKAVETASEMMVDNYENYL